VEYGGARNVIRQGTGWRSLEQVSKRCAAMEHEAGTAGLERHPHQPIVYIPSPPAIPLLPRRDLFRFRSRLAFAWLVAGREEYGRLSHARGVSTW